MQLAQFNIAKAIVSMDSPVIADFSNNTDRINALAEEEVMDYITTEMEPLNGN